MREADNLTLNVMKSGSLNLLEPSGPVTGLLYLYYVFDAIHWAKVIPSVRCVTVANAVCKHINTSVATVYR